ncbi:MAG: hypothetical protein AAGN64_15585 [Bacteroidota bacterium]
MNKRINKRTYRGRVLPPEERDRLAAAEYIAAEVAERVAGTLVRDAEALHALWLQERRFLTMDDLTALLGCTDDTAAKLFKEKRLRGVKLGGLGWRTTWADLLAAYDRDFEPDLSTPSGKNARRPPRKGGRPRASER